MSVSVDHESRPSDWAEAGRGPLGGTVGFWDMDWRTGRITGDEAFVRLMGLDPEYAATAIGLDEVLTHISLEDRVEAIAVFSNPRSRLGRDDRRYGLRSGQGELTWVSIARRPQDRVVESGGFLSGVVVALGTETTASRAFEASEFRFRALAEAIPQNVFSTDAHGVHDFLNRRWFDYTGQPYGPVAADQWLQYLHPEDRDRTMAAWRESLAAGRLYDIEYRYRRHDGQYRWMRVMALPERGGDGQITRWFGTATDIHDTKLLETEREVIAAELNHRIKNLFSVFGGLISLSARADKDAAEFAQDVQSRLSALALAHDFIGHGVGAEQGGAEPQAGVSLHALIKVVAKPYGSEGGGVLTYTGQDLMLSKAAWTPLTLIIHELLTNAVKYGALARAGGGIRIDTGQDERAVYLHWQETWREPLIVGGAGAGFGSEMLTTVVERLLHGEVERDLTPLGLSVRLMLPLDRMSVQVG